MDEMKLQYAIKEAIHNIGTGKALSTDLIPDDCFDKDKLL